MVKERNVFEFPDTFKVDCYIKSPKKYDVSEMIKVIGNKILNYNIAHIIIQYNDKLLNRFSTKDYELQAFLDKTIVPNTYNLIVKTKLLESLEDIICHEMVHFDQYERGDLKLKNTDNSGPIFIWKGEEFSSDSNYSSRPWEEEARSKQYNIWKQFKNLYYK